MGKYIPSQCRKSTRRAHFRSFCFKDSVISVKSQVPSTSMLCSPLCVDFTLKLGSRMAAGGVLGITVRPHKIQMKRGIPASDLPSSLTGHNWAHTQSPVSHWWGAGITLRPTSLLPTPRGGWCQLPLRHTASWVRGGAWTKRILLRKNQGETDAG